MDIFEYDTIQALLGYCPRQNDGLPIIYLQVSKIMTQDLDIFFYVPKFTSSDKTYNVIYQENPLLQRSIPDCYGKVIVVGKGENPIHKTNRHLEKSIHGFYLDHQRYVNLDFQDKLEYDYFLETPPLESFPVMSVFVVAGIHYFVLISQCSFEVFTLEDKQPTLLVSNYDAELSKLSPTLHLFIKQWQGIDSANQQRFMTQSAYYKKTFVAAIWENRLFWLGTMSSRGSCSLQTSLSGNILLSQRLLRSFQLPTLPCKKILMMEHKHINKVVKKEKTSQDKKDCYRFYYYQETNFRIVHLKIS